MFVDRVVICATFLLCSLRFRVPDEIGEDEQGLLAGIGREESAGCFGVALCWVEGECVEEGGGD